MTIKSKEGYYVKVRSASCFWISSRRDNSELFRSNGVFDAEVVDVSEYPVSDEVYGTGMGNPNVSYYTYSATITDKTVQVSEDDWLSVNIQGGTDNSGVIVLDKAFVRTENGACYSV